MKTPLGKLEKVDLREIWQSEAGDFTPWLAQEQNIALLGEAIGIDLEVEAQEKSVAGKGGPRGKGGQIFILDNRSMR